MWESRIIRCATLIGIDVDGKSFKFKVGEKEFSVKGHEINYCEPFQLGLGNVYTLEINPWVASREKI